MSIFDKNRPGGKKGVKGGKTGGSIYLKAVS
jgi:hypothetical protein